MRLTMRCVKQLVLISVLIITTTTAFAAPKRFVYTGDPIKLTLGVNEERRITFPDVKMIWADVNQKLQSDEAIDIEIINKNVYLKANKPFKTTRFIFGEEKGSNVYLLDIKAVPGKIGKQRLIVVKGQDRYATANKEKPKKKETIIEPLKRQTVTPTAGYKTLLDFAVREIYAPNRLRGGSKGIYRASVNTHPVYHLLRDNVVLVTPLASWRSGKLHVTALSVRNKTNRTIVLDPRYKRGNWLATSFFPRARLMRSGHPEDNTTLFLLSDKPFDSAIASNPIISQR